MDSFTELILLTFCQIIIAQASPCNSNSECSFFEICSLGRCMLNHYGCPNNVCRANEVCIRGQCHRMPFYRPPSRVVFSATPTTTTSMIITPTTTTSTIITPTTTTSALITSTTITSTIPISATVILPRAMPRRIPLPVATAPSLKEMHRKSMVSEAGRNVSSSSTIEPQSLPSPACRSEWSYLQKHNACYLAKHGRHNYHQANRGCQLLGASLASITSQDEMDFVNALMNGTIFWIGARKYNGKWFWEDTKTPLNYTNWRKSQPDHCCGWDVSCILVNYLTGHGQWEDAGCDHYHRHVQGYVCKEYL